MSCEKCEACPCNQDTDKPTGDLAIIEWEPKPLPLPLPIVMPVLPGRHIGWKRDRGSW